MKTLKVAVIGAGQIARVSHLPAYRKMQGVEVVGVSDVRLESAKALAEEFGIPVYEDDHRRMLEACKPDIVSVCVPNKFHCAITVDALNAGANVICEKPPAITVEEAEQMAEAARRNGRLLTYGFHMRYGDQVAQVKRMIERGELGRVYAARAAWLRRRGVPGWGVFTNKAIQGGGPLIDIGAHVLDLAAYLLDYPEVDYVCASAFDEIGKTGRNGFFGGWDPEKYTVEDALFGQICFKNGVVLRLDTSFALNMKEKDERSLVLYGQKQGVSLFPLEVYGGGDEPAWNRSYPFEKADELHERELFEFVAACRGEKPLLVTAEQGVYIQKLIHMLYESAQTHKPVFGA